MLSAKQGSCEYHFLKSFGMTRVNPRSADCYTIAPVPLCIGTTLVAIGATLDVNPSMLVVQTARRSMRCMKNKHNCAVLFERNRFKDSIRSSCERYSGPIRPNYHTVLMIKVKISCYHVVFKLIMFLLVTSAQVAKASELMSNAFAGDKKTE